MASAVSSVVMLTGSVSAARRALQFLWGNPMFTLGLVLLLSLILFGVIGSRFVNPDLARMGAAPLGLGPSSEYLLGTDIFGRDVLTLLILGLPNTLRVGLLAGAIGVVIGTVLGVVAGYYRTVLDTIVRSAADVMIIIPALAFLITISAMVRVVTLEMMAIIVGLFAWAVPARVIRAQMLSLRERPFVDVAKLSGESDLAIIFKELLPNLLSYLAAAFVGAVSTGILAAVGLEILGLGPQHIPTIGRTLYYAIDKLAMFQGMWWWWAPPVAILAIIFASLFMMSVALDKYTNPRLKR